MSVCVCVCLYLDAEVAPVHVVPQEQVAGAAGGPAHLEQLHEVKELSVHVSTHCTQTQCVLRSKVVMIMGNFGNMLLNGGGYL